MPLLHYILFQSYHELTMPLILRSSRHIAKVTLIALRVPKTNTKVFGPVEFVFPAFGVIRLPETGKTAENGKFTWLTMWLIEVTIFFGNSMYFYPRKPKMSSFLLSEVLFRSYHEKTIKSLISRCYRGFEVRSILF